MTDTIQTPNGELHVTHDPADTTAYVTGVTVSKEVKRSDGDYGSDSYFASQQIELRPALAMRDNGPAIKHELEKAAYLVDRHLEGQE